MNEKKPSLASGEIKAAGLDPKLFPSEKLFDWLIQARHPIWASDEPLIRMFLKGVITGEACRFIYMGGSTPGKERVIRPSMVFCHRKEGRIYIAGFCSDRHANRVFAADLILGAHAWN